VLSVLIKGGDDLPAAGLPSLHPERVQEALDSCRYGL
jgi:hypothetical protein